MEVQCLRADVNFSWHLVWLFALLEGVTVPLVPLFAQTGPRVNPAPRSATGAEQLAAFANRMLVVGSYGFIIGFVGTSIVCLLLNQVVFPRIKIRLDDAIILRVLRSPIAGVWGGVLLAVIFWIQQCIGRLLVFPLALNLIIFGFVSAAGSIVVTGSLYCVLVKALPNVGIQLATVRQRLLLARIPVVWFALLVGVYEGLAAPILQRWELAHQHRLLIALLVGVSGGAFSSSIVVALAHLRAIKNRLWLDFSVMDK